MRWFDTGWLLGCCGFFTSAVASMVMAGQPEASERFLREVRPILSDHCFQCHGPDQEQRQAGLRLDLEGSATAQLESGQRAVVPHDLKASGLVERIRSTDPSMIMPPPESGKELTEAQKEILERWISEGATYAGHWGFQPIAQPPIPEIAPDAVSGTTADALTAIDRFLVEAMSEQGLRMSPEADRETLLRRLSLDLTGLPPAPEQIDRFLSDRTPDAYEKVVDALLASPHYGERMAIRWLDLARYADSNGYQIDSSRYQWPWRDWLIQSLNRNQPFDQFTIEQLAGDLLPDATTEQMVATGFHRNHRLNGEGGIIAEEWRAETVIDRVETTGLAWLGLTFNCCRCHDHKYDPISQKEFYQFFAFFNNVPEAGTLQGESRNTEPVMAVPTAAQKEELDRLEQLRRQSNDLVATEERSLRERLLAWEPQLQQLASENDSVWLPWGLEEAVSRKGSTLTLQEDGSYLASGENPTHDLYALSGPLGGNAFRGLLLECLPDPSLPEQSVGRYANGNFVLGRVEAKLEAPGWSEPKELVFTRAEATYSQKDWEIQNIVARTPGRGWAVDGPTRKEASRAMFLLDQPIELPAGARLVVQLHQDILSQHNIGRFRIHWTGSAAGQLPFEGSIWTAAMREAVAVEPQLRSEEQWKALEGLYRMQPDTPIAKALGERGRVDKQIESLRAAFPTVMVMREGPKRPSHLLVRGQYDQPGEQVEAGLPAALPPMPQGAPMNRLGLARWIVDRSNPLTARVWVNRAWEHFFGQGLVKSTENLGSQADFPSHPKLLDWLASQFQSGSQLPAIDGVAAHPWDMKAIHKAIVMSRAYRQTAAAGPESWQRDPENRWLARGPRFRLPAELVRDQALAISGLLDRTIGGPSVRPFMPAGVWDETSVYGDLRNYQEDEGAARVRRTLYTIWKRTAAPPTMLLFDAPNRETCTVRRSNTNTPLQALALLNEATFVEAARKLGERMIREGGQQDRDRVRYGFRLAVGRWPSEQEASILLEALSADRQRLVAGSLPSDGLLKVGKSPVDAAIDARELAAYALLGRVLLNLDEVVTR